VKSHTKRARLTAWKEICVKTIIGAVAVLLLTAAVLGTPAAYSNAPLKATCFCKVSGANLQGQTNVQSYFLELTGEVNTSYTGFGQQNEDKQFNCKQRCQKVVDSYDKYTIASAACAAGVPHGAQIGGWSAVGTNGYIQARTVGTLTNTPAAFESVLTCQCPANWLSNLTNVPGGMTSDIKCKKLAYKPINISPLPPDGTQVGTWGFTWGDEVWAFGSLTNGGAASCVASSLPTPAVCKIQ
jgi:hypothetical protein